ncbi:sensor histidine kinase [Arthrobacter sp. NPDC090010]|uniref:sensor histidine kinase n=1 Tax=Arthrobacter sp. NPDC090010 TaxID=3363942 RepID=UPI003806920A
MTTHHTPSPPGKRRWTKPKSWPLRTKLVLVTMALLTVIAAVLGSVLYATMDGVLSNDVDGQLRQASHRAAAGLGGPGGPTDPLDVRGQAAGTINVRLQGSTLLVQGMINPDGKRVSLNTSDVTKLALLATTPEMYGPGAAPVTRELSVGDYRLLATGTPDGDVIVTGLPLTGKNTALGALVLSTVLVAGSALVVCAVVGTWLIRRTLRPLAQLSAVAGHVAESRLDVGEVALGVRVPESATDPDTEVGSVGHAFNRMLDNVSGALAVRHASEMKARQFVADASHELRTPLTAIRGYSEMISLTENLSDQGKESLSRVQSQSLRMNTLVEDLLTLARLDEGQDLQGRPVDLVQLAVEEVMEKRAQDSGHDWRLSVPAGTLNAWADPARLRQVLVNLLTNAQKHTPEGTKVEVGVFSNDAGRPVITVTDDGPGIPEELQPEVFSRFTRADKARTGGSTGLGLSIVQAIVQAHDGRVSVESEPGRTRFTVELQAAEAPSSSASSAPA